MERRRGTTRHQPHQTGRQSVWRRVPTMHTDTGPARPAVTRTKHRNNQARKGWRQRASRRLGSGRRCAGSDAAQPTTTATQQRDAGAYAPARCADAVLEDVDGTDGKNSSMPRPTRSRCGPHTNRRSSMSSLGNQSRRGVFRAPSQPMPAVSRDIKVRNPF
jgi:hypothetical protein